MKAPMKNLAEPNGTEPHRIWRRLLMALGLCSALCGAGSVPAAGLTLALAELPSFAPALIAEAEGYYAAEGLNLKILPCVNGRRCLKHLTDGEAQVATVANTPMMFAAHEGKAFEIVATMATSATDNSLIARSDRGIRNVADLKGKRIGFVPGTTSHFFTDAFLLFHGIDHTAVTLVPLDAGQAAEQLARGEVDAAGLYTPHGPHALALLRDKGLVLPSPRLYTVALNLVSQPGVAPADLGKLLRALQRAIVLINEQPERAQAVLARRLKMDGAALLALTAVYDFKLSLSPSLLTTLEAESRWAQRSALVPAGPLPDYLARIQAGPLRKLDRRAVTIAK
ncbi:NrtA/SsuA/CpmA family ABC transporter substrate-binding protein [soil metagenome]